MTLRTFVWGRTSDYGETVALLPSERSPIPLPDYSHGVPPLDHRPELRVNRYGFLTDGLSVWSGEATCTVLHNVEVQRVSLGRLRYLVMPKPGVVLHDSADRPHVWPTLLEGERLEVPTAAHGPLEVQAMDDAESSGIVIDEPTILLSHMWGSNYAHSIFDTMTRLWPWDHRPPFPVLWERTEPFQLEMADLWLSHCDLRTMPANRVRYKTLYLPTPRSISAVSPASVGLLRQRLRVPQTVPEKLYSLLVCRSAKATTRRFTNEDALQAALPGFERIELEGMSIVDQGNIFRAASRIVLAHGAAQANTLWCRPGTRVVEIVPDGYQHPMYQYWSKWLGHRYARIVVPSGKDWDMAPDPGLIVEALKGLG